MPRKARGPGKDRKEGDWWFDRDDSLWVVTENGVVVFKPDYVQQISEFKFKSKKWGTT